MNVYESTIKLDKSCVTYYINMDETIYSKYTKF